MAIETVGMVINMTLSTAFGICQGTANYKNLGKQN
jgi:hypothetical protein